MIPVTAFSSFFHPFVYQFFSIDFYSLLLSQDYSSEDLLFHIYFTYYYLDKTSEFASQFIQNVSHYIAEPVIFLHNNIIIIVIKNVNLTLFWFSLSLLFFFSIFYFNFLCALTIKTTIPIRKQFFIYFERRTIYVKIISTYVVRFNNADRRAFFFFLLFIYISGERTYQLNIAINEPTCLHLCVYWFSNICKLIMHEKIFMN